MRLLALMMVCVTASVTFGEEAGPQVVPLWPDGAPEAKGDTPADQPFIEVYLPRRRLTEAALIVLPGGGYRNLALDHEGKQIADWAASIGMPAFVVHYRLLPNYIMPTQLHDGQRAVRWVRANAAKYKIDPKKIGVMGFSAGGHLGSMLGVHFDSGKPDSADAVERVSSRPDFLVLVYPAINFDLIENPAVLGEKFTPEQREFLNTHKHVRSDTPPTFLFHTDEDKADHSAAFYLALRAAEVPAELHIYQQGRHGMGLAQGHPFLGGWPGLLTRWMMGMGVLDRPGTTRPSR